MTNNGLIAEKPHYEFDTCDVGPHLERMVNVEGWEIINFALAWPNPSLSAHKATALLRRVKR